jgi:hypothetical protein
MVTDQNNLSMEQNRFTDTTEWSHTIAVKNDLSHCMWLLYMARHVIINKYSPKQQLSRKPCYLVSKYREAQTMQLNTCFSKIETKWKSFPGSTKDNIADNSIHISILFVSIKFV